IGHAETAGRCASCGAQLAGQPWVWFEVIDDGRGMTAEVRERMFEPFFTTKEVGRGTGMGLAMVHGIVHDHGGHLQVSSAPGKGPTFRGLLPAAAEEASTSREAMPAPQPAQNTRELHGCVLLVEDDPLVGECMSELMSAWGLEVALVQDPLAAARRLEDDKP